MQPLAIPVSIATPIELAQMSLFSLLGEYLNRMSRAGSITSMGSGRSGERPRKDERPVSFVSQRFL